MHTEVLTSSLRIEGLVDLTNSELQVVGGEVEVLVINLSTIRDTAISLARFVLWVGEKLRE